MIKKEIPNYHALQHREELTHFSLVFHFYIPWKRLNSKGCLIFSGGMEMDYWNKIS